MNIFEIEKIIQEIKTIKKEKRRKILDSKKEIIYQKEGEGEGKVKVVERIVVKEIKIRGEIFPYLMITTNDGKSFNCSGYNLFVEYSSSKNNYNSFLKFLKLNTVMYLYDCEFRLIVSRDEASLFGPIETMKKLSKFIV